MERRRLSGWGEIAGHFKVSISTVQRWARREALPVCHHEHLKRGTPYAFVDELDAWEQQRGRTIASATVDPASGGAMSSSRDLRVFAVTAAGLIALLHLITFLAEVAYSPSLLSIELFAVGFAAAIGMGSTILLAMHVDLARTNDGRDGFWMGVALVIGASVAIFTAVAPFLPADPIVHARFQTFTGQSGYLKSAFGYGIPLVLLFVLGPFHAVLVHRREASSARDVDPGHRRVAFPTPRALGWLLAAATIWSVGGTMHLFENLLPSSRMNLFMLLVLARVGLWLAIAGLGAYWYAGMLAGAHRVRKS